MKVYLIKLQYEIIRNTDKSIYPCYELLSQQSTIYTQYSTALNRLSMALEDILGSLREQEFEN